MHAMESPTEASEIVDNAGDGNSRSDADPILKTNLQFFDHVLVLLDLDVNVRQETVFEGSFPWYEK
jgi:hypothetical protein